MLDFKGLMPIFLAFRRAEMVTRRALKMGTQEIEKPGNRENRKFYRNI